MARFGQSGRASIRLPDILRIAVILLVALAAAWLSFAVSASSVLRSVRPDLALEFMPIDARAKARLAELQLAGTPGDRAAASRAGELARGALGRDATVVSAWRTLALVEALGGRAGLSARLFHFAESRSRRDLPTQLWMIENRVAANDVAGALEHYDIALRTSSASAEILIPVMVAATGEASMVAPISRLLASDPPWRRQFIGRLIENAPSPSNAVTIIEASSRSHPIPDRDLLTFFVKKLVERRAFDESWRIYRLLVPNAPAQPAVLRNGDFERPNPVPPLDWQFETADGRGADQRQLDHAGAGQSLYVYTEASDGVVAWQAMVARPGDHVLSAQVGAVEGEAPTSLVWRVTCANAGGSVLAESRVDSLGQRARFEMPVRIPTGDCASQWLYLSVRQSADSGPTSAWVDGVRLTPRSAAR